MSKLFSPLQIGPGIKLQHRVAMAPLTRYRAGDDWVPGPLVKDYYIQRSAVPGTLLITEATLVSTRFGGRRNVPGIWSDAQVAAWKEIVDAIHAKGCFVVCQLWAMGRAGHADILESTGDRFLSASAVPMAPGQRTPEEMTEQDIQNAIGDYVAAAKNAMAAGFDGVEIHAGNGYLPDQFLQDTCNRRTDGWGGSVEKRSRFLLEVVRAMAAAVGAERIGVRLSPFSDFNGMLMADPIPQFEHVTLELRRLGGRLAYLHLIEARIRGNDDADCGGSQTVAFLVRAWDNASPVLLAGGFKPDTAVRTVDETYKGYDVAIVFGRFFVSNPDLVFRIRERLPLEPYDRSVFYTPKLSHGYIDYSFSPEFLASQG